MVHSKDCRCKVYISQFTTKTYVLMNKNALSMKLS